MPTLLVPDTNVFVQFQHFDGLPWKEISGHEDIALVVLAAVVRELDKLKLDLGSATGSETFYRA